MSTISNEQVLLKHVNELEIAVRTANSFEGLWGDPPVLFVGQLIQLTSKELLARTNFGRKSLKDVRLALGQYGLALGSEVPNWAELLEGRLAQALNEIDDLKRQVALKRLGQVRDIVA